MTSVLFVGSRNANSKCLSSFSILKIYGEIIVELSSVDGLLINITLKTIGKKRNENYVWFSAALQHPYARR